MKLISRDPARLVYDRIGRGPPVGAPGRANLRGLDGRRSPTAKRLNARQRSISLALSPSSALNRRALGRFAPGPWPV